MIDNGAVFRQNPRVEYRDLAEEGGVLLHLITALRLELAESPASLESDIAEFLDDMTARELLTTE
jgi:hypothetical protein